MRHHLDRLICLDIECTCWGGPPPLGQARETIAIGLCTLDLKTLVVVGTESILVRPAHSTCSAYCTALTGLTDEALARGILFADAIARCVTAHGMDRRAWASFGDFDRAHLLAQCEETGIAFPFSTRHLNIKTLAALSMGWSKEYGLAKTAERLGVAMVGRHHDAADDARTLAGIVAHLWGRSRGT